VNQPSKVLKLISLKPSVVVLNQSNRSSAENQAETVEEVIVAPFFLDEEQVIDDISELVDVVYKKFSEACKSHDLRWEAELEIGLEFGVKFSARLKLSPNKYQGD
jgi:hypothetical protein